MLSVRTIGTRGTGRSFRRYWRRYGNATRPISTPMRRAVLVLLPSSGIESGGQGAPSALDAGGGGFVQGDDFAGGEAGVGGQGDDGCADVGGGDQRL